MRGTVVKWNDKPVKHSLKPEATAFHEKSHIIPHDYLLIVKKEVSRLAELGVIKRCETES